MTLRRLKLWARALVARRRTERDLDDELAFHIERETLKQIANGLSPDAARTRAKARFGSVTIAADDCRDARGTTLIDSSLRDVLYAWRSFRRAPLAALTIVATVGLGLGLVAVVFTLLNAFVFLVDDVRDPHELFAIEHQRSSNAQPESFTHRQYHALVRETDVFSQAFALGPDVDAWIDGRRMEGTLVTGNFFQVLGVGAARGRAITPADDQLGGPQAIVLSDRAWSQYFGNDPGVLGRTVLVNRAPFQVIGVMPPNFRGLTVAAPDFWTPLSLIGQFRRIDEGRLDSVEVTIVGRLGREVSRAQALAQILAWDSRRRAVEGALERSAASLRLEPRLGTVPLSTDTLLLFTPLFFAFGLILVIGCANVANLLLARAVARQREIGVRLAIGASRRRIVRQLLTENLLLALISAAVGLAISRLVLSAVVYTMMVTFPPELGNIRLAVPPADWRVALFLVLGAMVSTVFFALAPALQATRLEVVRAMRGEVVRDARPGRARNALVALQVTGSVLLLICSAIFLRSAWASANVDPGLRTADVLTANVAHEQMRETLLTAVRSEPSITSVAASWPAGLSGRPALANGTGGRSPVTMLFMSPEYLGVLGIDLVRGRNFAPTERNASAAVAIVSETVARELWPGRDAIGQVLRLEPDPKSEKTESDAPVFPSRTVVVGIARDVAGFRFGGMRLAGAGIYVPITIDAPNTSLTMRVRGDPEAMRRALLERMTPIDPNFGEIVALRTLARMETYLLRIPFWLTLVLGALALMLTLSGLFSVVSYLVEQRIREIGVRMALGATRGNIGALVLSQSARPVVLGIVIGASLTGALGAALLATPVAEAIGSSIHFFDPVAYAAGLLCIVGACVCAALVPALRAGRIDPVTALRHD